MSRQLATVRARIGSSQVRAKNELTPRGLVALGTAVSMIPVGSAAIVLAARINLR